MRKPIKTKVKKERGIIAKLAILALKGAAAIVVLLIAIALFTLIPSKIGEILISIPFILLICILVGIIVSMFTDKNFPFDM